MDDLISRQTAIEAMRRAKDKSELHRMLVQLPSAQPVVISKSENATECEDAVSKEAVSSWLKQYGQDVLHGKYKFSLMYIWKKLMDLPSVTPKQPVWIPCSRKLPKQSGWYLVSLKNGNVQKAWYRVAPINQGGSYWRGSIKRPLAWMPLPTPYREGRQE